MADRSGEARSAWDARIDAFWAEADTSRPAAMWAVLEPILAERGDDDAEALFERASLHDALGDEHAAIPLYRRSLSEGLGGERADFAVIQLASSLRNVGSPDAALALLEPMHGHDELGAAARAFSALALHDLGRPSAALRLVLADHARSLPLYGRALAEYAALLPRD